MRCPADFGQQAVQILQNAGVRLRKGGQRCSTYLNNKGRPPAARYKWPAELKISTTMATQMAHDEVRAAVRQKVKARRHRMMRVGIADPEARKPVCALGAARVAAEYLELRPQKVIRHD